MQEVNVRKDSLMVETREAMKTIRNSVVPISASSAVAVSISMASSSFSLSATEDMEWLMKQLGKNIQHSKAESNSRTLDGRHKATPLKQKQMSLSSKLRSPPSRLSTKPHSSRRSRKRSLLGVHSHNKVQQIIAPPNFDTNKNTGEEESVCIEQAQGSEKYKWTNNRSSHSFAMGLPQSSVETDYSNRLHDLMNHNDNESGMQYNKRARIVAFLDL